MQLHLTNPHRNANIKKIKLPLDEWYMPCRRTREWFINIAKKKGVRIMWGDEGIPLCSPYHEDKIYTDERIIPKLKTMALSPKFIKKWFVFFKDFISDPEILEAKSYFKGYRLTPNDEGYSYNIGIINEIFHECEKERYMKKQSWRQMIIDYAKNARRKAKELEFGVDSVQYEIEALIKMMDNYFKLKRYYKSIKYVKKSIKINSLLKYKGQEMNYIFHKKQSNQLMRIYENNQQNILNVFNKITKMLKNANMVYIINSNKLIYYDKVYSFYCQGFDILRYKTGETLKGRIREKRKKRCGNCQCLVIRKKKYKKRKNKKVKRKIEKFKRYKCSKCQKMYYCNKHCQKRDWFNHKSICY